jgi:hypothetical protein
MNGMSCAEDRYNSRIIFNFLEAVQYSTNTPYDLRELDQITQSSPFLLH